MKSKMQIKLNIFGLLLLATILLVNSSCNKKCYINGVEVSSIHCNPKVLGKELYGVLTADGKQFSESARILLGKYSNSIANSLICTHGTLTDEQLRFTKNYFLQVHSVISMEAGRESKSISSEGLIKSMSEWGYLGELSENTKAAYEVMKIKTKEFFNIK